VKLYADPAGKNRGIIYSLAIFDACNRPSHARGFESGAGTAMMFVSTPLQFFAAKLRRRGVGFLGLEANWPGILLMAIGAVLLMLGASF
jgi:hypothetical protein